MSCRFERRTDRCRGRLLASRRSLAAAGDEAAPTIVFFHGVLRNGDAFAPLAAHLGSRYELWTLDHRGHGGSDRADRYLVVDYAADAVAWLREVVGRPVVLYGHSLGAMVAAAAAAECPDLVRGCVLEDPPFQTLGNRIEQTDFHGYFTQVAELLRRRRTVAELAGNLADIRVADPSGGPTRPLGELRDPVALRHFAASLLQVDPSVLAPLIAGRWLEECNLSNIYSRMRGPTLLMQADWKQGGMLADDDVDELRRSAQDVLHVRMPGVGHMMHWQRTQEVANLVFGFLEALR